MKELQPLTPEILVPRLGEYLVKQKQITDEDLRRALDYQNDPNRKNPRRLLGETLIEMDLIDRAILDQAITELIIQLRTALERTNRSLEQRVQERTSDLEKALERLSELNQLKANFIANISHELRTPLTHVKGYLELMSDGTLGPITQEQREALEVSQRAAARLENLIGNLILFSQAKSSGTDLQISLVDLNKMTTEVIKACLPKALVKNIQLQTNVQPKLPFVQADQEKLTWVITQLLDNAIKFTPDRGRVTLSIHLELETLIIVKVTDTGIGIPPGRMEEIFEPFHQLDGSASRKYGGTGLGLALVNEILIAHGSMIEVKSEVEKGSSFTFPLLVSTRSP